MLAFQNSKNGHNWGQEKSPGALTHFFVHHFSRSIDLAYREGLKRLIFQSYDFSIGAGVSKFEKWS